LLRLGIDRFYKSKHFAKTKVLGMCAKIIVREIKIKLQISWLILKNKIFDLN